MCNCDQNSQDAGVARGISGMAGAPLPSMARGMEDALCLAMMTGLLSTFVQSLMSHMANTSANQQSAVAAGSHTAMAGLAAAAKAADQILSDDNGNGDYSARQQPYQAMGPQATYQQYGPGGLAVS